MAGLPTRLYLQAHDLVYERLEFNYNINSITKEMQRQTEMKIYKNLIKINVIISVNIEPWCSNIRVATNPKMCKMRQ